MGMCLATIKGNQGPEESARYSPDGSRIITGSKLLWNVLPPSAGSPPDWLALREQMRAVRRAAAGQDTPYLGILRRFVPE